MRLALILLAALVYARGSDPSRDREGAVAQDLSPQTILVAHIMDHLRDQLAHLPEYTCLENIVRYNRQAAAGAKLRPLDHLQLEVLYSGTQEWYGWPGAPLEVKDPSRFIGGGMIGNGLFALFQQDLLGDAAVFTYVGEDLTVKASAGPAVKYDFRVPRLRSAQKISLVGGEGHVGLKGSFWADPQSLDLLRLAVEADEIPPYLPLAEMSADIHYANTRIGAGDIQLAQSADLHMRELFGEENYDRFDFTHCSQFHAVSTMRFEAADTALPVPDAANPASPPAALAERVPALMLVTVQLVTPVSGDDAVGKPIEGRTMGNVLRKGKVAIPSGTPVRGRIRRIEQSVKPGFWVVGIEFTEIEIGGAPLLFYADLIKLDRRGGVQQALTNKISRPAYPGVNQETIQNVTLPEIPGVASFFVPGEKLSLPAGFWTTWRTRGILHY